MSRFFVLFSVLFSAFASAKQVVYVYAASSMTEVVQQAQQHFKGTDIEIKGVFGSSASLARQVTHKAPADIYISANSLWMDYVEKNLELKQESQTLASNSLVLVSPTASDAKVSDIAKLETWQELIGKGRLAIGEPKTVPVGIYAKEALTKLNVYSELKYAPMKNTRATLAMVERGQVPAGIVYKTDAVQSDKVKVLTELPNDLHEPITYPIVQLSQDAEVIDVYNYFLSDELHAKILELGFSSAN